MKEGKPTLIPFMILFCLFWVVLIFTGIHFMNLNERRI